MSTIETGRQTADAVAAADKEWRELIEAMLPLGGQVAAMWPEIGAGFMTVAHANDHHPDWFPCWSQVFNNGGNINPDGVYYMTPIDDQGIYRLCGTRGSLRIVDLQLGDGSVFAWG